MVKNNKLMISVSEAKQLVEQNIKLLDPVETTLDLASGLILAADVFAPTDIPAFPQSSMDGYALSFIGWQQHKKLRIHGEIAAGNNESIILDGRNAVRIFTGAAVPEGADTVVMQEKVKVNSSKLNELIIEDDKLKAGMNVRPKGSEITKGSLALSKGTFLSPAAVGFLAGIGVDKIKVYPKPSITIIVTGNELAEPGKTLEHGQVYESNSFSLSAILKEKNISSFNILRCEDDLETLKAILAEALTNSDVVLLTGGISAGDYDFVLPATESCGVKKIFHKVKQRPGKPLFFGKKENKIVFGLPGNPSSVLTCFYEYVIPAINKMICHTSKNKIIEAPLAFPFQKVAGLTHFLKGSYDGNFVTILDAQESYRMSSFAKANCLVQIDEEMTEVKAGDRVEVHLL